MTDIKNVKKKANVGGILQCHKLKDQFKVSLTD